jgi:hypothetical protein
MLESTFSRLASLLAADPATLDSFLTLGDDPVAWRARAAELGHPISPEEAAALLDTHGALSEDELEQVAGGWEGDPTGGGGGGTPPGGGG